MLRRGRECCDESDYMYALIVLSTTRVEKKIDHIQNRPALFDLGLGPRCWAVSVTEKKDEHPIGLSLGWRLNMGLSKMSKEAHRYIFDEFIY